MSMIRTIEWTDAGVVMLDQRLLPAQEIYRTYTTHGEVAEAIRTMVVRGAPAIGVAAAMGIALGIQNTRASSPGELDAAFERICSDITSTRPTAVNLFWAVERMKGVYARARSGGVDSIRAALVRESVAMHAEDVAANRAMGRFGQELVPDGARILTHCNAGALATAGYGTALGVIRAAVEAGKRVSVYADETRPFLQGARLTAWELQRAGVEVTVICDNMAGALMRQERIGFAIVGADRIAANGDTANKIGTYGLAILARHHGVPFYVAAPYSTIDMALADGRGIPIEQRSGEEIRRGFGCQTAPDGVATWNPAFDVTPADLIHGIVTERGILRPPFGAAIRQFMQAGDRAGAPR